MTARLDDDVPDRLRRQSRRARFSTSLSALQAAQKTPRGVSLYSTWVNRPLGRRLAAGADALSLRPNHVTCMSAACSFTAIAVLAGVRPSPASGVLASALLVLGFALDSADGQLARLRRSGSPSGEYLDHMLDCAVKCCLHIAVLIAAYRVGERGVGLLVPVGFQIAAVLLFFGGILVAKLHEQSPRGSVARPPRRLSRQLSSVFLLPVDHGVISLTFLLWGFFDVFQAVYLLLLVAHAAVLAAFAVAWFRELS
jgi:phosphatidylglycerophosphate synthase